MHNRHLFHYLLYIIPAVMDCVAGIFTFIGPVRAAILGYDPLVAGSTVAVRAFCNLVFGFACSRFLTPKNVRSVMLVSTAVMMAVCLLGLTATNLTMLYVTSALSGACQVVFSVSFQLFITIVDAHENRPLSKVIGAYTASWCTGQAFGPFLTGFLMALGRPADGVGESVGWIYTYLAAAGMIFLVILAMLWIIKTTSATIHRHIEHLHNSSATPQTQAPVQRDFAWLGWVTAVAGIMTLGMVRGLFPSGMTRAGLAEWRSGLLMMLMCLAMGWFVYFVALSQKRMYSGRVMLGIGALGCVGLLLYSLPGWMGWGVTDHIWQYYAASLFFGCFAGSIYMFSGYHSMVNPFKSGRNISLNETFCGAGMVAGPILGGWLMREYNFFLPFALFAALALGLGLFQYAFLRQRRKQ